MTTEQVLFIEREAALMWHLPGAQSASSNPHWEPKPRCVTPVPHVLPSFLGSFPKRAISSPLPFTCWETRLQVRSLTQT